MKCRSVLTYRSTTIYVNYYSLVILNYFLKITITCSHVHHNIIYIHTYIRASDSSIVHTSELVIVENLAFVFIFIHTSICFTTIIITYCKKLYHFYALFINHRIFIYHLNLHCKYMHHHYWIIIIMIILNDLSNQLMFISMINHINISVVFLYIHSNAIP